MARKTEAIINLSACRHNLLQVRRITPNSKILAMVKSNAYGHGLLQISRAFCEAGVDGLGVAFAQEAVFLVEQGVRHPIFVMEGFFDREEIEIIQQHYLIPVIHHPFQIELLESHQLTRSIPVWVKIDTGMHRLGFSSSEFPQALQRLKNIPHVQILGVMTHFANADLASDALTAQQILLFEVLTRGLKYEKSLSNSAGVLAWPSAHCDWVRPGIMLYGVSPLMNSVGSQHGLQPVMTLKSQLISIKKVPRGGGVSYGTTWRASEDTHIGIVAIGYGDGYPGHAPGGTPVLVNGQRVPLVGRVCMDMLAVNLGPNTTAQVGDMVTLWGEGLPVEEVARCANTIPYDLLCGVTRRVVFRYREDETNEAEWVEDHPPWREMAEDVPEFGRSFRKNI